MSRMPDASSFLFRDVESGQLPVRFAVRFGVYVRGLVAVLFWTVLAALGLALACVSILSIGLAARFVLRVLWMN